MLRALPYFGCRVVCRPVLRSLFTSDLFTESKGQFYYVIPEIPSETSQSNALLQLATLPK